MEPKKIFFIILNLVFIALLLIYWVNPGNEISFMQKSSNSEFNLENSSKQMQFYENMRFPSENISYRILDECSLSKKRDMERAFNIVSNETILNFYPTTEKEEISINCDEKIKKDGTLYIAGEGGPTQIIDTSLFKVILSGNILLIKDSNCDKPNVAIHELLHVLGFNHSDNKNNIMYPISSCKQTIGTEIVNLINELYSYPPKQDLLFEKASASISGRYLDLNFSIRNQGLKESEKTYVEIYANGKMIKDVQIESIKVGEGREIMIKNIMLMKTKIEDLKLVIPESNAELSNSNNEILLMKN